MAMLTHQQQIDCAYMHRALVLAEMASQANEVPIGAVVVLHDKIIGEGFNQTIATCDPSAHAEIIALRNAAQHLSNHRMKDATLYVTVEPCLMCCGALQHARVGRLVYGTRELRTGAVVSVNETLADPNALHRVPVTEGVLADECLALLQQFFTDRRG